MRFPQMARGTNKAPTANAMPPIVMNMFEMPMLVIQGTRADGMPTAPALRMNATPTKASAVSCDGVSVCFNGLPRSSYLSVCVNHKSESNVSVGAKAEGEEGTADTGVDPMHPLKTWSASTT